MDNENSPASHHRSWLDSAHLLTRELRQTERIGQMVERRQRGPTVRPPADRDFDQFAAGRGGGGESFLVMPGRLDGNETHLRPMLTNRSVTHSIAIMTGMRPGVVSVHDFPSGRRPMIPLQLTAASTNPGSG